MVNHIFDEEKNATLCGDVVGQMAWDVSTQIWTPDLAAPYASCPECLSEMDMRKMVIPQLAELADAVNSPAHYKWLPVEAIEITEHFSFTLGNALKYILRADHKGKPIEDLKKARWYLDREIARREKE